MKPAFAFRLFVATHHYAPYDHGVAGRRRSDDRWKRASALLASASVQKRAGAGEAAVVLPKLLFQACNVMLYGNIKNASPDHSRA